jgi:hypothetical protein
MRLGVKLRAQAYQSFSLYFAPPSLFYLYFTKEALRQRYNKRCVDTTTSGF